MTKPKKIFVLFWLIRFLLIFSIFYEYQNQRYEVLMINIIAFLLTFTPFLVKKLFSFSFPNSFKFLFYSAVLVTVLMEKMLSGVFVQLFLGVFLGFVGLILMFVLYYDSSFKTGRLLVAFFSFCFSVSLGAIWEVFRFGVFSYFDLKIGSFNSVYTPQTLFFTMIGAFIASTFGYVYLKYGKRDFFKHVVNSFMKVNPRFFENYKNSVSHIFDLIKRGENEKVEFKSTFRTNLHTNKHDRKMEHAVLKTISAFLNSEGGTLLVGVSDDGNVVGLERDGFKNYDIFYRHFLNLLKDKIGSEYLSYIDSEIIRVEDEGSILKIDCDKSRKEVFLKDGDSEEFYVRAGPSSVRLDGSKLVSYIDQKFKKS